MAIEAWWNAMDLLLRVLYGIALPASALLIVQLIIILIGLDHGIHADGLDSGGFDGFHYDDLDFGSMHQGDIGDALSGAPEADFIAHDFDYELDNLSSGPGHDSDMGSLHLLSLSGILSFLTVFGWAAILLYQGGMAGGPAVLIGLGLGYGAMFCAAKIVQLSMRLSEDGTLVPGNTRGRTARVYITIPASGEGEGKVNLIVQERFVELSAVTQEPEPILPGTLVHVADVHGDVLVVENLGVEKTNSDKNLRKRHKEVEHGA